MWVCIPLRWGVLDTTLCDKVCQWLATGLCFSPFISISFTNKTGCHNITEILLKVALNTTILTLTSTLYSFITYQYYWTWLTSFEIFSIFFQPIHNVHHRSVSNNRHIWHWKRREWLKNDCETQFVFQFTEINSGTIYMYNLLWICHF